MIKKEEYANSTMRSMNKSMLIDYIHRLTHNLNAVDEMYERQCQQLYKVPTWHPREHPPEAPIDNQGYLCRIVFGDNEDMPRYMILGYMAYDENPHFQHERTWDFKVTHWCEIPYPEVSENG